MKASLFRRSIPQWAASASSRNDGVALLLAEKVLLLQKKGWRARRALPGSFFNYGRYRVQLRAAQLRHLVVQSQAERLPAEAYLRVTELIVGWRWCSRLFVFTCRGIGLSRFPHAPRRAFLCHFPWCCPETDRSSTPFRKPLPKSRALPG